MACRPEMGDLCDFKDDLGACLRVLHELGAGASLSAEDATKRTPAHYAAKNGLEFCLRALHELGAGASLSAEDAAKHTPAHFAAINQETDDDDDEDDVWIGDSVTIMSGVTIGDGVVIANNSHVVKDIEPYSLVGGNPAKLIKYRFTQEQIKKLLEIKWWLWDDEKINKFSPLLCNPDIDNFINEAIRE
jgi:hypothetical protein